MHVDIAGSLLGSLGVDLTHSRLRRERPHFLGFQSLAAFVVNSLSFFPEPSRAAHHRALKHHEVADYAAWRKAYSSYRATQRKMGVTAQAVYQAVDNPNDVVVTHDFASAENAKAGF